MTHHAKVPEPDGTQPQDDDTTPGGAALRLVPSLGAAPDDVRPRSTSSAARPPAGAGRGGRRASAGRRRRRLPRTVLAWHERGRRTLAGRADAGMATAEYAIATLAAVGFAGLLVVILKGNEVKGLLLGIIRQALSL